MNIPSQQKLKFWGRTLSSPFLLDTTHTTESWIEISEQALHSNIAAYKNILGANTLLAPVIKANAYGHGMLEVARVLETVEHIEYLCVAQLSEALALRANGIQKPLLVLSIIDVDPHQAVIHDIDIIISNVEVAQYINECGQKLNKKVAIHIKIDTGLSRMGVLWSEALDFITICNALPYCAIKGLFSHFANSENEDPTFAQLQITRFKKVVSICAEKGIHVPYIHIASSAAQTALAESHCTMARLGIGLYGLWPSPSNQQTTKKTFPHFTLQPVMTWKTKINQIKNIPADSYVGYDLTFKTTRPTRIAVLPIGYSDGYDRALSNKGIVKIRDTYAPIIGRVAMNLTMIDVTDIPNISLHDIVTLMGNDEKINADSLAKLCSTINYEIVSRISPFLPRIIIP